MTTAQELVLRYMPLANKLAYKTKKTMPKFIGIDELRSAAYLGLVEAASRYNPDLGVAFSTFAYRRIFGAIYDYLRELGCLKTTVLSLDLPSADGCTINDSLAAKEEKKTEEFTEVISLSLGEQAAEILGEYFIRSETMKDIGKRLGVTESRVSQLIRLYKQKLQERWTETEMREMLAA